jgi:hypothetical protein
VGEEDAQQAARVTTACARAVLRSAAEQSAPALATQQRNATQQDEAQQHAQLVIPCTIRASDADDGAVVRNVAELRLFPARAPSGENGPSLALRIGGRAGGPLPY